MQKRRYKEPIYCRLKEALSDRITQGILRPGDCVGSEKTLSAEFYMSRPTVRKAIDELVHEGLVCRVPGKGTFVADPGADRQPRDDSKVISLVVPDVQGPFIGPIYKGLQRVADEKGYMVAVYSSDWDIEKENQNILLTMKRGECGTIIFPNWGRNNYLEILQLKRMGFPFVLIDRYFKDFPTDHVVVDNFTGAFEAVEHLITLGHRSIAFIMGVPGSANDARFEGYRQALLSHGLPFREENVATVSGPEYNFTEPHVFCGQEETLKLMKRKNRPTAIFAGSDLIALGVLQAIKGYGLSVPDDVAVVGFDDLDFAAWPDIQLTTVAQPKEEIGAKAAELLIEKIEAKRKMRGVRIQQLVLSPTLIVRSTCGGQVDMKVGEDIEQLATAP